MSKLHKLVAENFKRLKLVEITLDGDDHLVIVRGDNGAGKTSILDGVESLFGGKDAQPPRPIREGETHSRLIGEVDDLIIERTFTEAGGTYISVKGKDGQKHSSPQSVLDKFYGALSFDPLSYTRLSPGEQMKTLQKLVGIDFAQLEAERKAVYEERTAVNREAASLEARVKALPPAPTEEPVDIEDLIAEQELLQQAKTDNDGVRAEYARACEAEKASDLKTKEIDAEIRELEKKTSEARRRYEAEMTRAAGLSEKRIALEKKAAALVDPNLSEVASRIKAAHANAAAHERAKQRQSMAAELAERQLAAQKLTGKLELIDQSKADRLQAAKFPVEGLSFGDAGVTFKGLPLEQASGAEQLRVAVAIGLALNPKLRVMLVREGSLLDANSLRLLRDLATKADAQIWLEVVGEGDVGIVIEDGSVKAVNGVAVEQQSLLPTGVVPPESKAAKASDKPWDRVKALCAARGITDEKRVKSITKGATGKKNGNELDDADVAMVESALRSGVHGGAPQT